MLCTPTEPNSIREPDDTRGLTRPAEDNGISWGPRSAFRARRRHGSPLRSRGAHHLARWLVNAREDSRPGSCSDRRRHRRRMSGAPERTNAQRWLAAVVVPNQTLRDDLEYSGNATFVTVFLGESLFIYYIGAFVCLEVIHIKPYILLLKICHKRRQ